MNTMEQMPELQIDEAPTVKIEQSPVDASQELQETPETQALEEAKQAELIAKQVERLTKDAFFTQAADKFLETIDDTFVMKGARNAWNKMPESAQDAYLASRFIPNPVVSMYPQLTKLMVDMGVLERKGTEAEQKVVEGIENDRRFDQFVAEITKTVPETKVAGPIVEQIVKAKEAVRQWMDGRREKLLAVRRANEAKELVQKSKKADAEHVQNLREDIQDS